MRLLAQHLCQPDRRAGGTGSVPEHPTTPTCLRRGIEGHMPFGVRLLLLQFACAHTARRPLCLPRPDAPRPRVGRPHSRSPCPCEPCLGMSQAQPELLPQKHLFLRLSAMGNRVKTQAARIGAWFVKLYGTLHSFPLKCGSLRI